MLSSNAYFTPSNKTPMPGKAAAFKLECDWDQFDKDPAGNLVIYDNWYKATPLKSGQTIPPKQREEFEVQQIRC